MSVGVITRTRALSQPDIPSPTFLFSLHEISTKSKSVSTSKKHKKMLQGTPTPDNLSGEGSKVENTQQAAEMPEDLTPEKWWTMFQTLNATLSITSN